MAAGSTCEPQRFEELMVLAEFLPFRLAVTAQSVSELIATTCENRFGLSIPAWRTLCLLAEVRERALDELAVGAALDRNAVAEAAASLTARGLARAAGPAAGLAITATGRRVHAELSNLALAAQAALLAGFSPAEVRTLSKLLGRLEAAALKLTARG